MRQYVFLLREHPYITPVIVALVIGFQAFTIVPYMTQHEAYPDYEYFVLHEVFQCELTDTRTNGNGDHTRAPLKWWLHCLSFQLTGYPNYFAIAFNIGIMPMTYLLATKLTNDKIIGLIALIALINIPLYDDWKTSGTYDMSWAFFMLLSIYCLYTFKEYKAGVFFGISLAFKSLGLLYLPAWLYSARKNKTYISIVIVGMLIVTVLILFEPRIIVGNTVGFYPENLDKALFQNISLLWQVIPFMMGLAVLYAGFKGESPKAMKDVVIWVGWIILTTPIIHLFTMQDTYSYRFVVMASFLAILTGQVLVRLGNWYVQMQMNKSFINHNQGIKANG